MSKEYDFSGTWHSKGFYQTTSKSGRQVREEDVRLYQVGNQLVVQTVNNDDDFYLLMRLSRDERILTGTWYIQTGTDQANSGINYYGAIQLIIDEDGNALRGKYVGFNRDLEVMPEEWIIERKK